MTATRRRTRMRVRAHAMALARRGARRLPPAVRARLRATLRRTPDRTPTDRSVQRERARLAAVTVFADLPGAPAPAADTERALLQVRRHLFGLLDRPDELHALRARLDEAEAAAAAVAVPRTRSRVRVRATDDDLVARADALIDAVDNAGAADLFEAEIGRTGNLTDRALLRWATALHRCSRYERALDVLAVCTDRAAATVAAAETAWVLHDHTRGAGYAAALARLRPDHPRAGALVARFRAPEPALPATGTALVHVASYVGVGGNYGDRVLPVAVRRAVSSVVGEPVRFVSVQAHQLFDAPRRELAEGSAGVIVGGGGLFLPDTAPNGTSGWQWNVPTGQLRRLDVPLAVVAVGFNLFRGQSYTGGLFVESLRALVDRAEVVGLRNHGSIRQVRSLLPARLADKIEYLPCPTTVLALLDPSLADRPDNQPVVRRRSVLINAAYDRSSLRFGDGYGDVLYQLARYVVALQGEDVDVQVVSHMAPDEQLAADLGSEYGLELPLVRLDRMSMGEAYGVYRRAGVVVGMRGHATMIPFGLRTPVLSLISHPKMRYFLDDIDHPEWGFEIGEAFEQPLLERTRHILTDPHSYIADIDTAQQTLLRAVQDPLRRFVA